jgi:hypothetical protein
MDYVLHLQITNIIKYQAKVRKSWPEFALAWIRRGDRDANLAARMAAAADWPRLKPMRRTTHHEICLSLL